MTHTPGRAYTAPSVDGLMAVQVWGVGCVCDLSTPEGARRIAALWNMADELGLSTEDIEAGCVQKVVASLRDVQRDNDHWGTRIDDDLEPFTEAD